MRTRCRLCLAAIRVAGVRMHTRTHTQPQCVGVSVGLGVYSVCAYIYIYIYTVCVCVCVCTRVIVCLLSRQTDDDRGDSCDRYTEDFEVAVQALPGGRSRE